MRILGARIFLRLLAGKLDHFEQPILTNLKKKITAHAYFERPYFSKFFGGKIETYCKDPIYKISSNIYFGFRSKSSRVE